MLSHTDFWSDLNQLLVKQLKNRYSDPGMDKRFVLGVDRAKMTLYDTEQSAQDDILDDAIFDETPTGQAMIDKFKEFV